MVATQRLTTEDLERLGPDYRWYELVDGELRERGTMGGRHGEIGYLLGYRLGNVVVEQQLGRLYTSDTRFIIQREPETTYMPDVAFVRADRLPSDTEWEGPLPLAPDLVVEVISPTDRFVEVTEKIERYRRSGAALIWLVNPRNRTLTVYTAGQEPRTLAENDELDGGDVVPGFRLPIAEIFR